MSKFLADTFDFSKLKCDNFLLANNKLFRSVLRIMYLNQNIHSIIKHLALCSQLKLLDSMLSKMTSVFSESQNILTSTSLDISEGVA